MDQIEAIAVALSAVNLVVLVVNYVAAPVRLIRKQTGELMVEMARLQERFTRIERTLFGPSHDNTG